MPFSLRQVVYLAPYKFGQKKNLFLLILLFVLFVLAVAILYNIFNRFEMNILYPCPEVYQGGWLKLGGISEVGEFFLILILLIFPGVLFYRYNFKETFVSELDILYLRTFTGSQDFYILRLLTSASRNKGNLGFSLPPNSMLSTWDPYLVFFSGNLLFPFNNLPFLFKENTSSWKNEIELLMKNAGCIVIDTTIIGEGTKWEISILKKLGLESKTIALIDEHEEKNNELLESFDKVISYNKNLSIFSMKTDAKKKKIGSAIDEILVKQGMDKFTFENRYQKKNRLFLTTFFKILSTLCTIFFLKSYFLPSNIEQAIYFENHTMIKRFISEGQAEYTGRCKLPHLVRAFKNNNYETAELLLKSGVDPNIIFSKAELFSNENSPLTWAVKNNNLKIVKLLLKYSANPNFLVKLSFSKFKVSPLYFSKDKNPEIRKLLIEYGGNPNKKLVRLNGR